MDAYCLEIHKLENKFYGLKFHHVIRDNNVAADVLSKLGSTRAQDQRVSLSTSFTRHPSQSRCLRPLIQRIRQLARRS
jgi:hypothetical protein